ncbi:hypothetical protein [Clostridium sp. Cult2]|uniref:hypothetical protein n=1 Tax=Clostridium sp. Cult2 TaxID=2079003 RepID=UPI001F39CBDD|nr:hypothetical protein [Clostridium sp. Cult2]MCF6465341.1 hypothetical protein [Clostridium sp. Cult2]
MWQASRRECEYEKEVFEYIQEFIEYNSEINGTGGLDRYDNYNEWLLKIEKDLDLSNIPDDRVPAMCSYQYVGAVFDHQINDSIFIFCVIKQYNSQGQIKNLTFSPNKAYI